MKESVRVTYLEEKTLTVGFFFIEACSAAFLQNNSFAWLQP